MRMLTIISLVLISGTVNAAQGGIDKRKCENLIRVLSVRGFQYGEQASYLKSVTLTPNTDRDMVKFQREVVARAYGEFMQAQDDAISCINAD
jgi:hypothetical protein